MHIICVHHMVNLNSSVLIISGPRVLECEDFLGNFELPQPLFMYMYLTLS